MFDAKSVLGRILAALVMPIGLSSGCSPDPGDGVVMRAGAPQESPERPGLVMIVSLDTLRADHLGLYGYDRFTSPTLDLLAAGGTVFTDASSTSPWTLPAHASMLTGRYPIEHRVVQFDSALPKDVASLAKIFSEHGYRTAAVVNSTWLKQEPYRLTRDFDEYLFVDDPMDRRGPNTWITDQAISWIRERGDQPLFLFVHYFDIHADYASLPEYERLFVTPYAGPADGTAWQLAKASFEDDYLEMCHANYDPLKCRIGTLEHYLAVDRSVEKIHFNDADLRYLEELYDAGIRQVDTEISRLFSALDDEGLTEESLVVITSDHGEEFMDHGRMDHFLTVYQEVLRVPLIFRGSSIPRNLRIETPVSLVDIAPTVLSIAGIPVGEEIDGLNLLPLMKGQAAPGFRNRFLYGEAAGGLSYELMMNDIWPVYRSVRRGPYKLVYDSKQDRSWLYDLTADPSEKTDVSQQHPEMAKELLAEMTRRYVDFAPTPAPEDRVELDSEELERLRSLGYLP